MTKQIINKNKWNHPIGHPLNKPGLIFALAFGLIMTIVGLAQLFAAGVVMTLNPGSQSATSGQTKNVNLSLSTGGEIVNGGYIQINFDSDLLDISGLQQLSSAITVTNQRFYDNSVGFEFRRSGDSLNGNYDLVALIFVAKNVSSSNTASISGAGVAYKGSPSNPSYYPASALNSNISVSPAASSSPPSTSPPSSPPPESPPPGSQSPGQLTPYNPPPATTQQTTPPTNNESPEGSEEQQNQPEPDFELLPFFPEQNSFSEEYSQVPGLLTDSIRGSGENTKSSLASITSLLVGLGIVTAAGGALILRKKLASSPTKKPKSSREQRPSSVFKKATSEPMKQNNIPSTEAPKHTQQTTQAPSQPQPKPVAHQPATKSPTPKPAATQVIGMVMNKPWEDIRKEQAAKMSGKSADDSMANVPDMFDLAEQHPESFGSQSLYDEESGGNDQNKK